ncbi:MAG: hypothetical protein K8R21_08710 [Leptospira sp.]|nr:hypothetical protein [Leptospira sp.]
MNFEKVQSVILEVGKILGADPENPLKITKANQPMDKQIYPYGSYNVLVLTQDPEKSASKFVEPKDDQEFYDVTRKNDQATISLTFLHSTSIAKCFSLSQKAMNWFDSEAGLAKCEEFGITPQIASGDIADRTIVLDGLQIEYKAGFDVYFKSREVTKTPTKKTASAPKVQFEEEE